MLYDEKTSMLPKVAVDMQLINSDTTTVGNVIDLSGFDAATFIVLAGVRTTGDATPLIEDSNDNITYAAVADDFLIGTEAAAKVDATNEITRVGYVGKKRYLRVSIVTATSANLTVGAVCVLGKATNIPTA